jgi:predicted DNA-binding protein
MSTFNIISTPQIQFPLRLSRDLTHRFNQVSSSTRIPKSTLGRIAIKSLLDEIDKKGITAVLDGVTAI